MSLWTPGGEVPVDATVAASPSPSERRPAAAGRP